MRTRKNSADKPTMVDVARHAKTGLMTVSRVLNEPHLVREGTRRRVLEAIRAVGYQPNEAARLLRGQRARTIGVIVPDLSDPFFARCSFRIQQFARNMGYTALVGSSERSAAIELQEAELMAQRSIAGLLIVPSRTRNEKLLSLYSGIPVVAMDRPLRNGDVDVVMTMHRAGAEAAVQHLLWHGYQRIICIAYGEDAYPLRERIAAYKAAVGARDMSPQIYTGVSGLEQTRQILSCELQQRSRPLAVFCLNNISTVLVLRASQELRVTIPGDLALAGFDEIDLADILRPRITVVQHSATDLGDTAARLLFERIDEKRIAAQRAVRIILPARLMVRESCGCVERCARRTAAPDA